jgi:Mg2+/Co2+ transporter CorB
MRDWYACNSAKGSDPNGTGSSLATVIALRVGGEGAIAVAAGILTLVILIFAEVAPKTLRAMPSPARSSALSTARPGP